MDSAPTVPPESNAQESVSTVRRRQWWIPIFLGLSVLLLASLGLVWAFFFQPYGIPPFPRQVEIPAGVKLREVASRLQQEGLVRSEKAFLVLAYLKREQAKVRAGGYRIEGPISPVALLEKLTSGEVLFHRITFPEGWTLAQVAERLAAEGLVGRTRFLQEATDPARAADLLGFRAPSLEGFLFPDTYHFSPGVNQERILRTMIRRFQQAFDPSLQVKADEMGWSVLQAVTLASLIEKETGLAAERSLISGVFHRRLRLGMRLEADPSVIYGLTGFKGDLRRQDLGMPHPYNTYVISGLPPGPICNPGHEALKAALFPSDKEYLYFVSRNDGSHQFSKSLREHARAVERYQRAPTGKRIESPSKKERGPPRTMEKPPEPETPPFFTF